MSKETYLLEKIVERIKRIKGNKEAKQDRLAYYRANKHRLKDLCLQDLHDFRFEEEVRIFQNKYDLLKKAEKLERHKYAPELNRLHLKNGTSISVPGCTSIGQAVGL